MGKEKETGKYICNVCKKAFGRRSNLNRHVLRHSSVNEHHCSDCGKVFSRNDALARHKKSIHPQEGLGMKRKRFDEEELPAPKKLRENPKYFYKLEKIREKKIEKFNTTNTIYKANVKDLEVSGIKEILKALKVLFSSMIEDITPFAQDQDFIRMSVQSRELDFPIQIPFMRKRDLTAESVLSEIERVLQSFEHFVLDGSFEIDIIHVRNPKGRGRKKMIDVDLEKFLSEKKCFIQISNKDELCCARAIITAKAKIDNHPLYGSIRHGRGIQEILAKKLHEDADVQIGACGLDEVKKFQKALPGLPNISCLKGIFQRDNLFGS